MPKSNWLKHKGKLLTGFYIRKLRSSKAFRTELKQGLNQYNEDIIFLQMSFVLRLYMPVKLKNKQTKNQPTKQTKTLEKTLDTHLPRFMFSSEEHVLLPRSYCISLRLIMCCSWTKCCNQKIWPFVWARMNHVLLSGARREVNCPVNPCLRLEEELVPQKNVRIWVTEDTGEQKEKMPFAKNRESK